MSREGEAVDALRALISLDGAWFPCVSPCDHDSCALSAQVLDIIEQVR